MRVVACTGEEDEESVSRVHDTVAQMWVTFFIDKAYSERIVFSGYQVPGEVPVDLPHQVSTAELVCTVLASKDVKKHRATGHVKVNLQQGTFAKLVLWPTHFLLSREEAHEVSKAANAWQIQVFLLVARQA